MGYFRRNDRTARRLTLGRRANNADGGGLPRQVLALLAQPLDPALVSEREGRDGRLLQYIEGWMVINQANRIFGHDGWGTEVVGEVRYRPMSPADPTNSGSPTIGMYTASVRVTVRGCPARSDVGCAFVAEETTEAHETACKGAVTDALKRALRQFGDQFGNSLYDRRYAFDATSPKPSPASPARLEDMRRKVLQLSERLGLDEAKARSWVDERYGQPLADLGAEQLADAVRSLAEDLNRRNGGRRQAA
jgi:DNA recombination protein Rad52